jgi:hypothetical protein
MRDIRTDLQERADICQDQMRDVCAQFEKVVLRLQSERDARLAGLKSTLVAIGKLLEYESGTMGNVVPLPKDPAPPSKESAPPQPAPPPKGSAPAQTLIDRIRAVNS